MQNNWDFMDSTINDDVKNKSYDFFEIPSVVL